MSDTNEIAAKPVSAATVMLLRDASDGIEVLMLKRNERSDFGGAHVFPGGVVSPHDMSQQLDPYLYGVDEPVACQTLSLASSARAVYVAAIRECFEESGVLLACEATGPDIRELTAERQRSLAHWRARLDTGQRTLAEFCRAENLLLDCGALHYASFWTTPAHFARRYATRFFVARAPAEQVSQFDGRETTDSVWLPVGPECSSSARDGLSLRPPTLANLELLQPYRYVDEAIAAFAATDHATIPEITPRIRKVDGKTEFSLNKTYHPPVALKHV